MAQKTLILSKKQLDEIVGGDCNYFDGMDSTPDAAPDAGNKISVEGPVDRGYAFPTTADDISHTMTNNNRGFATTRGIGRIRESKKKDWEALNIFNEEKEHGNARLVNRNFGSTNGDGGKSYSATKTAICRKKKAEQNLNSNDPALQHKGAETLAKMRQNWAGLDAADKQYQGAKMADNAMNKTIKSAPKESGNGMAHTPKKVNDGIIY